MANEEDGEDPDEQGLLLEMVLTVKPLPGEEYRRGGPACTDEEDGQDPGEQGSLLEMVLTVKPLPGEECRRGGPACGR